MSETAKPEYGHSLLDDILHAIRVHNFRQAAKLQNKWNELAYRARHP